jgi:predicted HNH restriction endonuclease
MGFWKRSDVFPMIARIIKEVHLKRSGRIHHKLIEAEILEDAIAGKLVRTVSQKRGTKTPAWEAMAMVAAFGQGFPKSKYEDEFDRVQDHGYFYWPKQVTVANIYPDEVQMVDGAKFVEGATRQVTVNAYEREPKARQHCIAKYGSDCIICGFSFAETYGESFRGFIHVHHLRQLSQIGKEYFVDPIKDLRPVCPNCHAVLHHGNQTYSIEDVKEFLSCATRSNKPGNSSNLK